MASFYILGVFDPLQATGNIINLMKGGILIAALCCGAGWMLRGRTGTALAGILAAFLLFYIMDSGQYWSLGREVARVLTIDTHEQDYGKQIEADSFYRYQGGTQ